MPKKKIRFGQIEFNHLLDLQNLVTSYLNQHSENFKNSRNPNMVAAYDTAKDAAQRIRVLWTNSD